MGGVELASHLILVSWESCKICLILQLSQVCQIECLANSHSCSRRFTVASIPAAVGRWRRERCSSVSPAGVLCRAPLVGVIDLGVNGVQMAFTPTASSRDERSPDPSEPPSSVPLKEQERCVWRLRNSLASPELPEQERCVWRLRNSLASPELPRPSSNFGDGGGPGSTQSGDRLRARRDSLPTARPFGRVRLQPRPCATPAPRSRSWPHWPSAGSSGFGVRQGRPGCSPRGRSSCSMRSARSLV